MNRDRIVSLGGQSRLPFEANVEPAELDSETLKRQEKDREEE